MRKYVKTYESFLDESNNDGKMVGNYFLSYNDYNKMLLQLEIVVDQEEFDEYLEILDSYYNNGGEIQRVVFSTKVNKNLGHHWTHSNNDIDNYIQHLFEFLYEEGKVEDNPPITIINAITPPKNISIQYALEQYLTNPWEEEIHVINPKLLKSVDIKRIK